MRGPCRQEVRWLRHAGSQLLSFTGAPCRLWIEHQLQSYMQRRAALHDEHPVFTAHKIISPIEEESEEDVLEEEAEARAVPVVCLASAVASPSAGILDPADSKGHPTWLDGCEGKLFPLGK